MYKLLLSIQSAICGFSPGKIPPGKYEYSHINGRMRPAEATLLCEADLQCGGFTFQGTLTYQIVYQVFFFHYVSTIRLNEEGGSGWEWTSYTVNR